MGAIAGRLEAGPRRGDHSPGKGSELRLALEAVIFGHCECSLWSIHRVSLKKLRRGRSRKAAPQGARRSPPRDLPRRNGRHAQHRTFRKTAGTRVPRTDGGPRYTLAALDGFTLTGRSLILRGSAFFVSTPSTPSTPSIAQNAVGGDESEKPKNVLQFPLDRT